MYIDWEERARAVLGVPKYRDDGYTDAQGEQRVIHVAAALAQAFGEGLGRGEAQAEMKK